MNWAVCRFNLNMGCLIDKHARPKKASLVAAAAAHTATSNLLTGLSSHFSVRPLRRLLSRPSTGQQARERIGLAFSRISYLQVLQQAVEAATSESFNLKSTVFATAT